MAKRGTQNFKTIQSVALPLLPEILIIIMVNSKILESSKIMNNTGFNTISSFLNENPLSLARNSLHGIYLCTLKERP